MGMIKRLCDKISGNDELREELAVLQDEIHDRDLILKRIKIIATSNHYGYSQKDIEYRKKNCINVKLRKIFELASEFDETDKMEFWDDLEDEE